MPFVQAKARQGHHFKRYLCIGGSVAAIVVLVLLISSSSDRVASTVGGTPAPTNASAAQEQSATTPGFGNNPMQNSADANSAAESNAAMNDAGVDVDYSDESDSGGGDSDEADEQDAAADGDAQVGHYHLYCMRLILVANIIVCPHAPPPLALSSHAGGIPPPVSFCFRCTGELRRLTPSECVCMRMHGSGGQLIPRYPVADAVGSHE